MWSEHVSIRTATNSSGRPMKVGALIILGAALVLSSMPARAATCEDVRSLGSTEQNYWSKVLHLSSQQRQRIWAACYRDYHANRQETPIVFQR